MSIGSELCAFIPGVAFGTAVGESPSLVLLDTSFAVRLLLLQFLGPEILFRTYQHAWPVALDFGRVLALYCFPINFFSAKLAEE
jgi:hypothetical protein